MAVGDIYRVEPYYNIGSEITENVLHFRETTADPDPLAAFDLATAFATALAPVYGVDLFSDEAKVTVIRCRRIKPTFGVPAVLVFPAAEIDQPVGGDAGEPVPSQAAALTSWYSAGSGRNGLGRTYWPGVSVLAQNDGQLTPEALAQLQALANAIASPLTAAGPAVGEWSLCVYSRIDEAGYDVIAGVAHSNLATIRGRRNFPGVGT